MKSIRKGPKHWLALVVAGFILFVGGGGLGYMMGQQQVSSAKIGQLKKAPQGMKNRPSGKPGKLPAQNSQSSN